jgi:hypothetical protein
MRLTLTAIGIAAGIAAIFTLVPRPANSEIRLRDYKTKMQELAFCEKGYEIASSFPSLASRSAASLSTKQTLIRQADKLEARSKKINQILNIDLKEEALDLGIEEEVFNELLADTRAKAELAAVLSVQSVDSQAVFVNRLNEVCAPYLN